MPKNIFKIIVGLIISLNLTQTTLGQEAEIKLRFNEIMYDPGGPDADKEWIELFNYGDTEIKIIGGTTKESWRFIDTAGTHFLAEKPLVGSLIIKPGEFLILASNAEEFLKTHPNFSGTIIDTVMDLDNHFGFIQLKTGDGQLIDQAFWAENLGAAGNNKTLEYTKSIFREGLREFGSPGLENSVENMVLPPAPSLIFSPKPLPSPSPSPKPSVTIPSSKAKITISEIFANPDKTQSQWLEIKNQENQEVDLHQWKLIIDSTRQEIILNQQIKANSYLLIKPIQLRRDKEVIQLFNAAGKKVFEVSYSKPMPINWSAIRSDDGVWRLTETPTPGQKNQFSLPKTVAAELIPRELIPELVLENQPFLPETKTMPNSKPNLAEPVLAGAGLSLIFSVTFILLKKRLTF